MNTIQQTTTKYCTCAQPKIIIIRTLVSPAHPLPAPAPVTGCTICGLTVDPRILQEMEDARESQQLAHLQRYGF